MAGFGKGSSTSYPPKMGHKNGKIPPAEANASNGKITGMGSGQDYSPSKGGNTWSAPRNYATASKGQTTGHPSQKTSYPKKGMKGRDDSGKVISSSTGNNAYMPKGGSML